jgi:hypothetical protein
MKNLRTFEEFVNENSLNEYGRYPDFSILPLGSVNINTGKCKYFNIYDTWDDHSVEFWDDTKSPGNYKLVFTSGEGPILNKGGKDEPKKDDIRPFNHDQTFKPMFVGKFISWCKLKDLKDVAATMGIKSALGYTYK